MKYDPGVLDQLLAAKLHKVSNTDAAVCPPVSSSAAMQALDLDSVKLAEIDSWRAFIIGWEFALGATAAALETPSGDGSELNAAINDALHEFSQAREQVLSDRRLAERRENEEKAVAEDQATSLSSIALMADGRRIDWCAEPLTLAERCARHMALARWLSDMPSALARGANLVRAALATGRALATDAQIFVDKANARVDAINKGLRDERNRKARDLRSRRAKSKRRRAAPA